MWFIMWFILLWLLGVSIYIKVCCDVKFLQLSSSLSSLDPLLDRRIVAFICFSHSFTSPPYTEAASPKALVV